MFSYFSEGEVGCSKGHTCRKDGQRKATLLVNVLPGEEEMAMQNLIDRSLTFKDTNCCSQCFEEGEWTLMRRAERLKGTMPFFLIVTIGR